MSIKRTFNGATIIKPGAYTKIVVENLTGFPLQPTGAVGIIGEAVGGQPHVLDIISGTDIQSAKARYKSGPIADALELIANPSNDPRIANGASKIIIYKTNAGTQSALSLKNKAASPVNMIDMSSKNYGSDENLVNVVASEGSIVGSDAAILGSVAGPFTVATSDTLKLLIDGVLYTYTSSLVGSQSAALMVVDMNNAAHWAPSKPVIASAVGQEISVVIDVAALPAAKRDYGYMKVDASCTLDTIMGVTGSNRGKKGSRVFTFRKGVVEEVSLELGGLDQFSILYTGAGTSAAMSILRVSGELRLQTVIGGTPSDNLDILLVDANGGNKHTMKSLSDLINSHAAYDSSVITPSIFDNADDLDFYTAIDIKNVALNIRRDVAAAAEYISSFSLLANASRIDNVIGELETFANPEFFIGAVDGNSANSDFANGFEAFKEERIGDVVPLISKDTGPLTIDSINALALSHAAWGWSTIGKSERGAFVSKLGSKNEFKGAARSLNSGYVSCFGQQVRVLNKFSELVWLDPWALACIAAGMRAGAEVGEPITFKIINVNDVRILDGSWNPRKDYAEMIEAGCTIVEPLDSGGFRFVLGNTTYGVDGSFVWNRESVVQAAGFVAYDLRTNLELQFTGTKAKTGTAEAMANFIKSRMTAYLDNEIIVGDDLNKGLGYNSKSLRVSVEGNTAIINVSITPVQGIDFILPTIYLSDIRQSA